MLAVCALSLGIFFYAMSGTDDSENVYSSRTVDDIDYDGSFKKTETSSSEITTKSKLDQTRIGEFTESVENQIIISVPNDKVVSENNSVNQRLDLQHSYNLNQLNENNASEVNQKVDNFKLELEKAMESNFN